MVEISNSDTERILVCIDIAIEHYSSLKGLRNINQARLGALLKEKIIRKLKQHSKSKSDDKE